jgi:hypothetical protein
MLSLHNISSNVLLSTTLHPKRSMAQLQQPDWAHLLGSPFALAVDPFLSNRDIFALSACSCKVLRLRYDLGSWPVVLDDTSYKRFRSKRHSVPPCFDGLSSFDLVTFLNYWLRVRLKTTANLNVDALAGVDRLDLSNCQGITDVGALGGVRRLNLCRCGGITDVTALGGVHILDLSRCEHITDVSTLGGAYARPFWLRGYHRCECSRRREHAGSWEL